MTMRNIITLATTTPTNTPTHVNTRSTNNYVSNLNVDYSNNNNNYDSCTSTARTTTSQQLDELLFELSKEAGFKSTKNYKINNTHNTTNKPNNRSINTVSSNTFNNRTDDTFRSSSTIPTHQGIPTLHTTGYYSDAEVIPSGMPTKKHVIDLELGGRKKGSSGRIHEKITTNQKYSKEEYVGMQKHHQQQQRQQQQYKQYLQEQYEKTQMKQHQQNSHNNQSYSSAVHKSINNSEVNHKYHDRHGYGEVNIPPMPPPRKHVISPVCLTNQQQFDSFSAFNSYRKGRFETTNTENLSPPLEVKAIETARESEDEGGWERRKRENKSVDRMGEKFIGTSAYHKFRSGSLDIDLDDLVQRNLTNKASTNNEESVEESEQGAYYISGIERPALRAKNMPHTKYIFKICSPEGESKTEPPPSFSSHITIPEPAVIDRSQETALSELKTNLKDVFETNDYKEEKPPEPTPQKLLPAKEECEVISLEPIGPGVQLLEPEGSRDGRASASRIITRSLSATHRTPDTPNNFLTTTNYAAYDAFYQKQQKPVLSEINNQLALDNYSGYKKSDTISGFPNAQQQQQLMQQQWIQQQQNPLFFSQPVFVPFSAMPVSNNGNGVKEYKDTFKYSETHTNLPSHSLPCSPIMNPKLMTKNNNTAVNFNNTATNFNNNANNFFNNTPNNNFSMHRQVSIPIMVEGQHNNNNNSSVKFQQNNQFKKDLSDNNNTISGFTFSESKQHSYLDSPMMTNVITTSNQYHVNQPASPETIRSWTVSPGSSIKSNMASCKGEVKTEVISSSAQDAIIHTVEDTTNASAHDNDVCKVKDTAHAWHQPHITRAEAVGLLKNKPAGSFIVRNSQSYSGGYGLALKVNQLPPNVEAKGDDFEANFVRHFLIESTTKGVKLKGCSNEPVFSSLSALIQQHTVTPLSLPCKLILPNHARNEAYSSVVNTTSNNFNNTTNTSNKNNNNNNNIHHSSNEENASIYTHQAFSETNSLIGKVVYIESLKSESLSDQEAFEKAINSVFTGNAKLQHVTLIDMKINRGGVVMTDNKHKSFFRRHYPLETISYCAIDSQEPIRTLQDGEGNIYAGRVFGFIANNQGSSANKSCHLFLEFDSEDFSASNYLNLINRLIA